ncbi:hypothetical protein FJZ26_01135 [Candidatus Parvarchaeota archaeon]|nr:hypothetical protein [Candidatus Parvarchaeota archaeon]
MARLRFNEDGEDKGAGKSSAKSPIEMKFNELAERFREAETNKGVWGSSTSKTLAAWRLWHYIRNEEGKQFAAKNYEKIRPLVAKAWKWDEFGSKELLGFCIETNCQKAIGDYAALAKKDWTRNALREIYIEIADKRSSDRACKFVSSNYAQLRQLFTGSVEKYWFAPVILAATAAKTGSQDIIDDLKKFVFGNKEAFKNAYKNMQSYCSSDPVLYKTYFFTVMEHYEKEDKRGLGPEQKEEFVASLNSVLEYDFYKRDSRLIGACIESGNEMAGGLAVDFLLMKYWLNFGKDNGVDEKCRPFMDGIFKNALAGDGYYYKLAWKLKQETIYSSVGEEDRNRLWKLAKKEDGWLSSSFMLTIA